MPKAILFVNHRSELGGAEYSLLHLLKFLNRNEWEPHVACPHGTLADTVAKMDIKVHAVVMPRLKGSLLAPLHWREIAVALTKVAKSCEAKILFANTVRASFYSAKAARISGLSFVWQMQELWVSEARPKNMWLDRLAKSYLAKSATRIIAISKFVAAHLPAQEKVSVVPNVIDLDRFDLPESGPAFRATHKIPLQAKVAGYVSRLIPPKGHDCFLRVMANVKRSVPTAWFLIVGSTIFKENDPYPEKLRNLANQLGIGDCTVFTGQLPNPAPAYQAMDVFVSPGEPEAFGLVNLEAMAMSKPVVAFNHGPLPEIVRAGETGLLVPSGDESALAKSTVELLRNTQKASQLGHAGRERVVKHFVPADHARNIEAVLREIT